MTKNTLSPLNSLARKGNLLLALIIIAVPFHAFLTTWLGSSVGHSDLLMVWKELLLVVAGTLGIILMARDKSATWKQLIQLNFVRWIIVYILFVIFGALITLMLNRASLDALLYGLIIQLRLFVVFALSSLFSLYDDSLIRNWQRILLIPASIVVLFGLAQVTILPSGFLEQFGYGPDTIPAIQTVDNKQEYQRIQSTMRGANPLGAYLAVIICACAVGLAKRPRNKWIFGLGMLSSAALYFTYSRSAWGAVVISLLIFILVRGRHLITKRSVTAAALALIIITAGVWWQRDNNYIQNTLFHADETSRSSQSSNQQRRSALFRSSDDLIKEPFGSGVGTAGPASYRNDTAKPRIAENYFVQTGQELGLIGLTTLSIIMFLTARFFWQVQRQSKNNLALMLFISLIGLTLINLVSHAWADDTLALIWWTLAGACTAHAILNKVQTNEKAKAPRI